MELSLVPHPEGGWYRRTYESRESVSLQRGERACSSSILYFLKTNERSCLHQLKSDEIWYFHWGSPVRIHQFNSGKYTQHILSAGTVFGAECMGQGSGSLISCMVSPGYEDEDFSWAQIDQLLRIYPEQRSIIEKLSRNGLD